MYYVYVLINEKKNLYIGFTKDLKKRVEKHNSSGTKYTSRFKQWKLIYYEAYLSEQDARRREKRLKDGRARYLLKERIAHSIEEI